MIGSALDPSSSEGCRGCTHSSSLMGLEINRLKLRRCATTRQAFVDCDQRDKDTGKTNLQLAVRIFGLRFHASSCSNSSFSGEFSLPF